MVEVRDIGGDHQCQQEIARQVFAAWCQPAGGGSCTSTICKSPGHLPAWTMTSASARSASVPAN